MLSSHIIPIVGYPFYYFFFVEVDNDCLLFKVQIVTIDGIREALIPSIIVYGVFNLLTIPVDYSGYSHICIEFKISNIYPLLDFFSILEFYFFDVVLKELLRLLWLILINMHTIKY